jgi:hypothetical protein
MQINHLCNNPPCTRIEHLEIGTQKSNIRYMWKCGRHPGNGQELPDQVILEMRQMAHEGYSQHYIAECLGANQSTVSAIVRGVDRANVGGPITVIHRPKSSKFIGVLAVNGKWRAQLSINNITQRLGTFGFEGDAAICWNAHVAWLGLNRPLNTITEEDWHHD